MKRPIHIYREPGARNYCRRREMVPDERPDINGNVPMGGSYAVQAHPRARFKGGDDRPSGYFVTNKYASGSKYSAGKVDVTTETFYTEMDDSDFCVECRLIETVMKANNTTSTNTARCILKKAQK